MPVRLAAHQYKVYQSWHETTRSWHLSLHMHLRLDGSSLRPLEQPMFIQGTISKSAMYVKEYLLNALKLNAGRGCLIKACLQSKTVLRMTRCQNGQMLRSEMLPAGQRNLPVKIYACMPQSFE